MDFSWLIFVAVMVINDLWMGAIFLAAQLDKSLPTWYSIIPGTNQKFLPPKGFWTMTYGDLIGVPLIVNAFVHLAMQDIANLWWGLPIAMVSTGIFAKMCLGENHKPDYGFPDIGKISLAGILHLPYFGVGIGASAMSVWSIFTGELTGPVLWVALAGGAIYIACFVAEIKFGNFDQIKRTEK